MAVRHYTPPPVITLEQCWHRTDTLADDIGKLEDEVDALREKVDNLIVESARNDERSGFVTAKLDDHSTAVRAFRYRDGQLVLLGSVAMAVLGMLLKWAFGIKLVTGQ